MLDGLHQHFTHVWEDQIESVIQFVCWPVVRLGALFIAWALFMFRKQIWTFLEKSVNDLISMYTFFILRVFTSERVRFACIP